MCKKCNFDTHVNFQKSPYRGRGGQPPPTSSSRSPPPPHWKILAMPLIITMMMTSCISLSSLPFFLFFFSCTPSPPPKEKNNELSCSLFCSYWRNNANEVRPLVKSLSITSDDHGCIWHQLELHPFIHWCTMMSPLAGIQFSMTVFTREQSAQFEWSFEWRYFGPCVRKIIPRCVIWIAQFKWRSGGVFQWRISQITQRNRCMNAFTSKLWFGGRSSVTF